MSAHTSDSEVSREERWDRVTRALAAGPRRCLLVSLTGVPPESRVHLPEAADPGSGEHTSEELVIQLKHHHLPLLEDDGFVAWADDPFSARRGPNFAEIGAVLDVVLSSADDLPTELVHGCLSLEAQSGTN